MCRLGTGELILNALMESICVGFAEESDFAFLHMEMAESIQGRPIRSPVIGTVFSYILTWTKERLIKPAW